jgi:SSS family solute:Na+ symporter
MSLSISTVDLCVLIGYLVAVVAFGVWIGRGQKNIIGYLLGGRDLPWWALLGSIVATETSTVTFLSVPGIAFSASSGDLRFLQLSIGLIVGRCFVILILLPLYFRGRLFTAYQVLHHRFGGPTQEVASLLFLGARNLGDGLRLFLTAIVLQEMIGVPLPFCVVIIGVLTIVYTYFGGIKSVVWNDCVQFVVYVGGGILALAIILQRLPGGFDQFVQFGQTHDKFRTFDFTWNVMLKYTFWSGLIGGAFLSLGTHGVDQLMVQRYLCARSQRDAARAVALSGVIVFLQFALFLLLGIALAAYYEQFPPPEPFKRGDRVFASFIVQQLPAGIGVIGIILAAVFSAAMSTLSSSLNSSASSAVNDLYLPRLKQDASDRHQLWASRLFTVFFGLLQIAVGIAGMRLADSAVDNVLAIASFAWGLLLGVFGLGVASPRVNQTTALSAMVAGLLFLCWAKFFTDISWPWYALIGSGATFLIGMAVVRLENEGR